MAHGGLLLRTLTVTSLCICAICDVYGVGSFSPIFGLGGVSAKLACCVVPYAATMMASELGSPGWSMSVLRWPRPTIGTIVGTSCVNARLTSLRMQPWRVPMPSASKPSGSCGRSVSLPPVVPPKVGWIADLSRTPPRISCLNAGLEPVDGHLAVVSISWEGATVSFARCRSTAVAIRASCSGYWAATSWDSDGSTSRLKSRGGSCVRTFGSP